MIDEMITMNKGRLALSMDAELIEDLKRRKINISKECEDHLRRVIDYKDEVNIQSEEMKIEKEKLRLEQELSKLNALKEKNLQKEDLLKEPLVIESLKLLKNDPQYAKGRANLIKNKLNVVISATDLLEMAEKFEV